MKKILLLASLLFGLQLSYAALPGLTTGGSSKTVTAEQLKQQQQRMLMEQFVKMSVKDYEKFTGKKMNFLQKTSFRIKQKIVARELRRKDTDTTSSNTLLLVILAILLAPLAVYLHENAFNGKFWLDLILWLIFILPGVIYALIVVLSNKK